jgi:hypothetical protein
MTDDHFSNGPSRTAKRERERPNRFARLISPRDLRFDFGGIWPTPTASADLHAGSREDPPNGSNRDAIASSDLVNSRAFGVLGDNVILKPTKQLVAWNQRTLWHRLPLEH